MSLLALAGTNSATGGYEIENSLKLEADNTEYLNRVIASGGNRKTWTISAWVKRTEISDASHGGGHTIFGVNVSGNEGTVVRFNTGTTAATLDTIQIDIGAGGTLSRSHTSQVFRDTAAWYHIVLAVDTTQSTDTDRFKLYVNGELVTSYYSRNNPAQNFDTSNNQADNSCTQHIGAYTVSGTAYGKFCGYIAEVNHVDGAALAPTEFGEFDDDSGIWKPIKANPTYGTNGFFLDFADSGNLGDDESGNGLDFTENNITAADQATDTPTNNFCIMNVIWGDNRMTFMSEGATEIGHNANSYKWAPATMGVANGKWYWEIKPTVNGNTLVSGAGIASNETTLGFYQTTGNFVYHYDGHRYVNGAATGYGAAWATNDIIGFAYDADNWTLTCYVNNSSQGNLLASQTDISSELFIPYVYSYGTHTYQTNFGGYTNISNAHTNTDENGYGSFVYAPPSGYYALCTKNLEEYG